MHRLSSANANANASGSGSSTTVITKLVSLTLILI